MNDEFPPTELSRADIDKVMKQLEQDAKKPTRMPTCPSCEQELPVMLTDYYSYQCQQCFYDRIFSIEGGSVE